MKLSFNKIDVTGLRNVNSPIGDVIPMGDKRNLWLTPFAPIVHGKPIDWRQYAKSDRIHIPMFPYVTRANPTDIFGFGMQLGLQAMEQSGRLGEDILQMHLAIGEPAFVFQDGDAEMARIWLGVGLAVRRK